MARKKKTLLKVDIIDIADRGLAIGKATDGQIVLVQGAIPGDNADILVLRKKKGLPFGIVQNFNSRSEFLTNPQCAHFNVCGGCKWQDMTYAAQLNFKEKTVINTLQRMGRVGNAEILPICGSDNEYFYRNKLEFSFSNKRWLTEEEVESGVSFDHRDGVGFHVPGAFDKVVDVQKCWLQPDPSNAIRNEVRKYAQANNLDFYDIRGRAGMFRSMIVRNNRAGDLMIIFSIYDNEVEKLEACINHLLNEFPAIKSVHYCINQKANDTILDLPLFHFFGQKGIIENLDHVEFQIGPKSFFQTNPNQAERLYQIAASFAELKADETVYDLYCGLGSITLYLAKDCHKIIGIEEVPEAIEDAKENAKLNKIENASFYAGDVRYLLQQELVEKHGRPDVIITDPPRAGMHKEVVENMIDLGADRIVYVSCNPSTQARDVALMSEKYEVVKFQPVDMFPHTHHIENVALLKKKQK